MLAGLEFVPGCRLFRVIFFPILQRRLAEEVVLQCLNVHSGNASMFEIIKTIRKIEITRDGKDQ